MTDHLLIDTSDGPVNYTFDFTNDLPSGATLSSAAVTIDPDESPGLAAGSVSVVSPGATVPLTGGVAGRVYSVKCLPTWSDGEVGPAAEAAFRVKP